MRRAGLGIVIVAAAPSAPARGEGPAALKGPEIEAALVGKQFRVTTRRVPVGGRDNPTGMATRTDGGYADIDMFVRADRSIIFQCVVHMRDGSRASCTGGGYARDVGVWSVEGDHFCYQFTASRGGRKQCYAVLRDGAAFRLRLTSGPPSSVDGERMVRR
jgi:hypothetical protein